MRITLVLLLGVVPLLAVASVLVAPLAGDAHAKGKQKPDAGVAAHDRDEAIQGGLRYLDKTVFRLPDASGTPRKPFTVAVTGLVDLLARDAKGLRTDGRKNRVDRARVYLERYVAEVERRTADEDQLPARHGLADSRSIIQYTWPLSMAAVFYGELHARGRHKGPCKRLIRRIARLLREAQQTNGGWGHGRVQSDPPPQQGVLAGMGGYPNTLLASTNCVAMSLGLTQGLLDKEAGACLPRARTYLVDAQLDNGNFPYDPSQRSAHRALTGVSRAAGSAFALFTLGMPWRDPVMARSLAFIDEHFDYLSEGHGSSTLNFMHAALLQRARGKAQWNRFRDQYFRRILDAQGENGALACICRGQAFGSTNDSRTTGSRTTGSQKLGLLGGAAFGEATSAYVTSIHTLILLLDRTDLRLLRGHKPKSLGPAPVTPR